MFPAGVPFAIDLWSGGPWSWSYWSRQVTVPAIPPCTTATLDPSLSRLPRNQSEGLVPKMTVLTGAGDPLECTLRKVGVDDAEFTIPQGAGSVHLVPFNGGYLPGSVDYTTFLHTWATGIYGTWGLMFFPCPETSFAPDATEAVDMAFFTDYHRLFLTEDSIANWTVPGVDSPWFADSVVSPWSTDAADRGGTLTATIDTSTADGANLNQWLELTGEATSGTIPLPRYRHSLESVTSPATLRLRGLYGPRTPRRGTLGQRGPQRAALGEWPDLRDGNARFSGVGAGALPRRVRPDHVHDSRGAHVRVLALRHECRMFLVLQALFAAPTASATASARDVHARLSLHLPTRLARRGWDYFCWRATCVPPGSSCRLHGRYGDGQWWDARNVGPVGGCRKRHGEHVGVDQ